MIKIMPVFLILFAVNASAQGTNAPADVTAYKNRIDAIVNTVPDAWFGTLSPTVYGSSSWVKEGITKSLRAAQDLQTLGVDSSSHLNEVKDIAANLKTLSQNFTDGDKSQYLKDQMANMRARLDTITTQLNSSLKATRAKQQAESDNARLQADESKANEERALGQLRATVELQLNNCRTENKSAAVAAEQQIRKLEVERTEFNMRLDTLREVQAAARKQMENLDSQTQRSRRGDSNLARQTEALRKAADDAMKKFKIANCEGELAKANTPEPAKEHKTCTDGLRVFSANIESVSEQVKKLQTQHDMLTKPSDEMIKSEMGCVEVDSTCRSAATRSLKSQAELLKARLDEAKALVTEMSGYRDAITSAMEAANRNTATRINEAANFQANKADAMANLNRKRSAILYNIERIQRDREAWELTDANAEAEAGLRAKSKSEIEARMAQVRAEQDAANVRDGKCAQLLSSLKKAPDRNAIQNIAAQLGPATISSTTPPDNDAPGTIRN